MNEGGQDQRLETAIGSHRSGRLQEAASVYQSVLVDFPEHPVALHLLGVVHHQLGKSADAVKLISKALFIKPDIPEAYNNLGNAYLALDQSNDAIVSFGKAIVLNPAFAEAHYNLGRAFQSGSNNIKAANAYQNAIQFKPDHALAHNNLGNVLQELGRLNDAEIHFHRALAAGPGLQQPHINLGHLLRDAGRLEEAVAHFEAALTKGPAVGELHIHLGMVYSHLERHEQAIESYQKAVVFDPNHGEAHFNLGHALMAAGRLEEAVISYEKALEKNPKEPVIYFNLGNVLVELGKMDQAILRFEQAVALDPGYKDAHQNLAQALLLAGKFEAGYETYKRRWNAGEKSAYKWRKFPQPLWEGTDLTGKSVLIWAEQGLGDEIVFASLYTELIRRCARCYFEVEPRLVDLFRRSFPSAVIAARSDPPATELLSGDIDFQAPAGDLLAYLMPSFEDGPDRENYLIADREMTSEFATRYRSSYPQMVVGLGWQTVHPTAHRRNSVPPEIIDVLVKTPGAQFVNLQYGDHHAELEDIYQRTGVTIIQDDVDPLKDMDRFAAQMKSMDLVISIVNSTAVLASALDIPVWGVVPKTSEWRWGNQNNHCLWYPSMRLFRSPERGGWGRVYADVSAALSEHIDQNQPKNTPQ